MRKSKFGVDFLHDRKTGAIIYNSQHKFEMEVIFASENYDIVCLEYNENEGELLS